MKSGATQKQQFDTDADTPATVRALKEVIDKKVSAVCFAKLSKPDAIRAVRQVLPLYVSGVAFPAISSPEAVGALSGVLSPAVLIVSLPSIKSSDAVRALRHVLLPNVDTLALNGIESKESVEALKDVIPASVNTLVLEGIKSPDAVRALKGVLPSNVKGLLIPNVEYTVEMAAAICEVVKDSKLTRVFTPIAEIEGILNNILEYNKVFGVERVAQGDTHYLLTVIDELSLKIENLEARLAQEREGGKTWQDKAKQDAVEKKSGKGSWGRK